LRGAHNLIRVESKEGVFRGEPESKGGTFRGARNPIRAAKPVRPLEAESRLTSPDASCWYARVQLESSSRADSLELAVTFTRDLSCNGPSQIYAGARREALGQTREAKEGIAAPRLNHTIPPQRGVGAGCAGWGIPNGGRGMRNAGFIEAIRRRNECPSTRINPGDEASPPWPLGASVISSPVIHAAGRG
jgi:hypothetical protein